MYQIQKDSCTLCLGCLQACPVYAMELTNGSVSINESRCISCGTCQRVCRHGAVNSPDQTNVVRELLCSGRKVILSLDPSCWAFLPDPISQIRSAAKKRGFWDVSDASEASEAVAAEYVRLLWEKHMENVILTQCPVVRTLVERYHPALTGFLAPVASPMIAHGRMIKKDVPGAAVVYVAACSARMSEAEDVRHSTEINAVLSFHRLMEWLYSEETAPEDNLSEPENAAQAEVRPGIRTAVSGGMMVCVKELAPDSGYTEIVADGMDRCIAALEQLEQGNLSGCVLELSACAGGCVGSPEGGLTMASAFSAGAKIFSTAGHIKYQPDSRGVALANPAIAREVEPFRPEEMQIQEIMERIGVANPKQHKNCGACGFSTCRERAEAVLHHEEPCSLCSCAAQDIRIGIFSIVFDAMPMAALLVDDHQKVVALNREAKNLFSIRTDQEQYIFELMDPSDFQYVMDTGLTVKNRRLDIPGTYTRVEARLVPLRSLGMVLGLFEDITEIEEQEAQLQEDRLQSVEMAQKVIEKQMTVAQQIAYLLGETTAETKATLNQLKQRILEEEEQP